MCKWCSITKAWYRFWSGYCHKCSSAMSDAGIYLQGGGPPCPEGSKKGQHE
jgi:hypothetical protein